jgi:hypothetical protein
MRPLIQLNVEDSVRVQLYQDYINSRQTGDPYQGLIANPNDVFLTLDYVRIN